MQGSSALGLNHNFQGKHPSTADFQQYALVRKSAQRWRHLAKNPGLMRPHLAGFTFSAITLDRLASNALLMAARTEADAEALLGFEAGQLTAISQRRVPHLRVI